MRHSFAVLVVLVSCSYGQRHRDVELYPPPCPSDRDERYNCVPSNRCETLRARSSVHFCGRHGDESLVCCPSPTQQGSKCGRLNPNLLRSSQLRAAVVGGVPLRAASSSPWMVAVGERTRNGSVDWYCGGTLVQKDGVLTAAHCTVKRVPHIVRVGELDFSSERERAAPQDLDVCSVDVHPDYQPPAYYHDVAVLRLCRPVGLGRYVTPACLPPDGSSEELQGRTATLVGWGHLMFGGERTPQLQEVSVTIYNNSRCDELYSHPSVPKQKYPHGIISSQLCAGDEDGGKDACQGDSGGPLIVRNNNVHTVVGVVSSGIGCGSKAFPGVYSRVSSYTGWIRRHL